MKRPVVWTAFYLLAGILAEHYISSEMYIALFFIITFFVTFLLTKQFQTYVPFIFYCFLLAGFGVSFGDKIPQNSELEIHAQNQEYVTVTGIITAWNETKTGKYRLTIKSSNIVWNESNYEKRLKLSVLIEKNDSIEIGQEVQLYGKLLAFQEKTVPGDFDEKLYMHTRGFDYKIYPETIESKKMEVKNHLKQKILFISDCVIPIFLDNLRNQIGIVYDSVFPSKEAGIIKGMVIGNKDDIEFTTVELYRKAGVAHIIAISGLHIAIISAILFFILQDFLKINKKICAGITIFFLLFYMVFTGCSASTVRAVVMSVTVLLGKILYRDGDNYNTIAFAAVLLLLVRPLYLWDAGFQLSFVTVTGLLMGDSMMKKCPLFQNKIMSCIGISVTASVASFPVAAYHFHYIACGGMIANLIIVPLVGIVIGFGMLVGVIGFLSIPIAMFFGGIVFVLLKLYEFICMIVVAIPFLHIHTGSPSSITIFLCYASIIAVYFSNRKHFMYKGAVVAVYCCLLLSISYNRLIAKETEITFLDVGQGDGAVIKTYDDVVMVIDAGGNSFSSYGNNTGVNIVAPFLSWKGVDDIDILFITHMDTDHALGAIELMEIMNIKKVVISDYNFEAGNVYNLFLKTVEKYNIPLYTIHSGDNLILNDKMKLECLYPIDGKQFYSGDDNHGSMVLKFIYDDVSVLFTGDASSIDEDIMLSNKEDLSADILKLGHHGSKYSSSVSFLDHVNPKFAMISSGKNNVYKHPNEETMERLKNKGIQSWNTAQTGTIRIRTNGEIYSIDTMIGRYKNEGTWKADEKP